MMAKFFEFFKPRKPVWYALRYANFYHNTTKINLSKDESSNGKPFSHSMITFVNLKDPDNIRAVNFDFVITKESFEKIRQLCVGEYDFNE